MSQTEEKQEAREKLKSVKALYVKACLNIARNVIDLPVILYFMNHGFTQTQAGFFGTCTSAISLYNMWGQKWL